MNFLNIDRRPVSIMSNIGLDHGKRKLAVPVVSALIGCSLATGVNASALEEIIVTAQKPAGRGDCCDRL